MSHTPGPWAIEETGVGDLAIVTPTQSLADVQIWSYGVRGNWDENNANARLIAAAPELLNAIKRILPLAQASAGAHSQANYDFCLPMIEQAEAAIAKAEGADTPGQHEATNAEASA